MNFSLSLSVSTDVFAVFLNLSWASWWIFIPSDLSLRLCFCLCLFFFFCSFFFYFFFFLFHWLKASLRQEQEFYSNFRITRLSHNEYTCLTTRRIKYLPQFSELHIRLCAGSISLLDYYRAIASFWPGREKYTASLKWERQGKKKQQQCMDI